jgi:hypothetical protein
VPQHASVYAPATFEIGEKKLCCLGDASGRIASGDDRERYDLAGGRGVDDNGHWEDLVRAGTG